MNHADAEARRSRRLTMAMPARCRTLGGFVDDVVIRDLSPHGCRVVSQALTLHPGARVVLRPTGIEGLCGEVRWVSGHQAGIEFERPLYEPVVEHLHRRFASFLPPEVPWQGGRRPLAA
jgi:hypothetical protein